MPNSIANSVTQAMGSVGRGLTGSPAQMPQMPTADVDRPYTFEEFLAKVYGTTTMAPEQRAAMWEQYQAYKREWLAAHGR